MKLSSGFVPFGFNNPKSGFTGQGTTPEKGMLIVYEKNKLKNTIDCLSLVYSPVFCFTACAAEKGLFSDGKQVSATKTCFQPKLSLYRQLYRRF
jgi:hypothetical protein